MSELVGQGETELQSMAAAAAVSFIDMAEAAKSLGLSEIEFQNVLGQPGSERSMYRHRDRRIKGQLANKALKALDRALEPSSPPSVQIKAVQIVLTMAGHMKDPEAGNQRRIEEMTYDELQAIVRQVDGETERRAVVAAPIARSAG